MAATEPEVLNTTSLTSLKDDTSRLPPLIGVCIAAPVDGGVKTMQSKPTGSWYLFI